LGLSYLLPRAIGSSRAFEIMLSGRDVGAEEAAQIGMVSKTVDSEDLLNECYAITDRICGFSQLGVEITKQMLWAGMDAGSMHSHMNHEGHAQLFVRMTTKNFEEAIKARKENRSPDYKD
jgi:enoyl-CoA hydratase